MQRDQLYHPSMKSRNLALTWWFGERARSRHGFARQVVEQAHQLAPRDGFQRQVARQPEHPEARQTGGQAGIFQLEIKVIAKLPEGAA